MKGYSSCARSIVTFDICLHDLYVRVGVRFVITKFSRMDSLPNFVTHGAPLRIREAIAYQREKRLPISYLALKLRYKTKHIQKVELKRLNFYLVYVFLFSAKTRIYKQKNTHIQNVELKILYFNFV